MRFRRCHIFGGKLILQFPFYLVCVHVSDVKTEVAFLRPMSGLSAVPASVGSGLGLCAMSMSIGMELPGARLECAKRGAGAARTGQDIARGRFAVGVGM